MDNITKLIRILLDGQAYLYAMILQEQAARGLQQVDEKQLQEWMDEWKQKTAELIGDTNGD